MSSEIKKTVAKIINQEINDILADRFKRYAKYVIQERAIPDVRDGLKPVQRRILFAMHELGLTFDKPFKKSARIVGEVIGKFHPHGDTSVYEALVRMSQTWKTNLPVVLMHGNNGSIDDDPPAAMRYTETKLAKITELLLTNLAKDTVTFIPNFDDSEKEPVVLPASIPLLFTNGSTGIAAGYSTNIAPHNLSELLTAAIYRLQNPDCTLEALLKIVQGPDFPTGGKIIAPNGFSKLYLSGNGKFIIQAKTQWEKTGSHFNLIITEIPFEVIKANILREINRLIEDQKIYGIREVRDETDRQGLRIVVELAKDANQEAIRKYLFRKTSLQTNYSFNAVAIVGSAPKLLGLISYLDEFIAFQKEILILKSRFELRIFEKKFEIFHGLVRVIQNLDLTLKIIREAANKQTAKITLVKELDLTETQVNAVLMMRLYSLTSSDTNKIKTELQETEKHINRLRDLLQSEKRQKKVVQDNLLLIHKIYGQSRKTIIQKTIDNLNVDLIDTVKEEQVWLRITFGGYAALSTTPPQPDIIPATQPNDLLCKNTPVLTTQKIFVVFNDGTGCLIPVHQLKVHTWKTPGSHLNTLVNLGNRKIVNSFVWEKVCHKNTIIVLSTKNGFVKKMMFQSSQFSRNLRFYMLFKINSEDEVNSASLGSSSSAIVSLTTNGWIHKFKGEELRVFTPKTAGVRAINPGLKTQLAACFLVAEGAPILILLKNGRYKKLYESAIPYSRRGSKGLFLLTKQTASTSKVYKAYNCNSNSKIEVLFKNNTRLTKNIQDLGTNSPFDSFKQLKNKSEIQFVRIFNLSHQNHFSKEVNSLTKNETKLVSVSQKNKKISVNLDEKLAQTEKLLNKKIANTKKKEAVFENLEIQKRKNAK